MFENMFEKALFAWDKLGRFAPLYPTGPISVDLIFYAPNVANFVF